MLTQAKATKITELQQQLEAQQQAATDKAANEAAEQDAGQRLPAPSQEAAAQSTEPRPERARSADDASTETADAAQTARQRRSARIRHEIHAAAAVYIERALAAITEAVSASLEEQLAEGTGPGQGQVMCPCWIRLANEHIDETRGGRGCFSQWCKLMMSWLDC